MIVRRAALSRRLQDVSWKEMMYIPRMFVTTYLAVHSTMYVCMYIVFTKRFFQPVRLWMHNLYELT
jgi:hypothetical protein